MNQGRPRERKVSSNSRCMRLRLRGLSRPVRRRFLAGSLARLLDRELAGEFDFTRLPDIGPEYAPGEQVRLQGALTDIQGEVLAMLSKGRVEVLVNFMGNITRAKIQATEVQRLEAAE